MLTKISRRRKWKPKWWIPTFRQGISTGTDEGPEKRQRSQPSGRSPRRAGMSGRTAKVKTRAKSRHHKNPGGRFWGTYGIGPSRNWAGRRCASAKNGPSTPGRQRTSSAKKTRSDTQGNPANRGRTTTKAGTTETSSSGARRRLRKIENSFMLRTAGKYN